MTTSFLGHIFRGIENVYSRQELQAKCQKKKPLRIKLGVDPTAPDLHLGHTVALNKLRQFQDQGHTAVLIIGDYTAMIGDPSGRTALRPPLSEAEVKANADTYLDQAGKILDPKRLECVYNSKWLHAFFQNKNSDECLTWVLARVTVKQLIEREDFAKRLRQEQPLSMLELLYPLLQGYDSHAIQADVELGGTDQLFNMMMGRDIQKWYSQKPQVVMTLPLLEGTDGIKKMSKSYDNYIALNDKPEDMFGKIMSVSDALMWKYYELLTDKDLSALKQGHPMSAKKTLAEFIVTRYHGSGASQKARDHFERVFSQRDLPTDMPEHKVSHTPIRLAQLLVESGLASSKNEARRLIQQKAVEADGEKMIDDRELTIHSPLIIKAGKRQFRKIIV